MFFEEYSSEAFNERLQGIPLPDFVQNGTALMNNNAIVQAPSAQLPSILLLTTFSNHLEILNRCKYQDQRIFYILYAYRERLKNKELQRCIINDTFGLSPTMVAEYHRQLIPKEVVQKSLDEFCSFLNDYKNK